MLAKTLVPDPNVLVLDAPASDFDPRRRLDLKNIIKRLRSEGKTVLISSHVLAETTEFRTSVAIMERGRMVVNGTMKEIAARVMGGTVLEIELLDGEEAFRRVIAADPHAGSIEPHDGRFSIACQGGVEATGDLLGSLVQNGVYVVAFAARKEGLGDLFLKVGARELS